MTTSLIFECEGTTLTKYRGRRKHLDTFPPGIDTIGNWVFSGSKSLESIVLPQGLKTIGFFTFMGCTNLKSIVIPDTVSYLGMYALAGCESLETIVIPGHLKYYGVGVFDGCTNLKRLVISPIDEDVLGILLCECRKIEKVEFNDGTEVNLEAIKKKGAQVRRVRAKSKREGKLDLDWEAWRYLRRRELSNTKTTRYVKEYF